MTETENDKAEQETDIAAKVLPGRRADAVYKKLHNRAKEQQELRIWKTKIEEQQERKQFLAYQLVDDLKKGQFLSHGDDSEITLLNHAQILDRAFRQVLEHTDGHVHFQSAHMFETALKFQKHFAQTLLNYHKIKEMNEKRDERTRQNPEL